MPGTYHQIQVQCVFAVKYRESLLMPEWRGHLFAEIGSLIQGTGCKLHIVNGVEDHVHCSFALLPRLSVSKVMQDAKAKSSGWLNQSGLIDQPFQWQESYAVFSHSKDHNDNVYHYIAGQVEHHKKETFPVEYRRMLTERDIPFEDQYLFHDPMSYRDDPDFRR